MKVKSLNVDLHPTVCNLWGASVGTHVPRSDEAYAP